MNPASKITNRYQDFRLLDLSRLTSHPEHHGPFMVVQDGADPADINMRPCSFVLTRQGTWLHYYLFLTIPREMRPRLGMFESVGDVIKLAESLPDKVCVATLNSLRQWFLEEGVQLGKHDPAAEVLLKDLSENLLKSIPRLATHPVI